MSRKQSKRQIKIAMLEALEKTLGVVTPACKMVGINRSTFYKYVNEDEKFAAAVEDVGNVSLDFAESQLFQQIKGGNVTAIIFYLKTKGKERGYIERVDHNHKNDPNDPVIFKIGDSNIKIA